MKKAFYNYNKVEMKVDERGRPLAFSLSGQGRQTKVNYRVVNILSWWREPGRWWEGEPVTIYLRLQATLIVKSAGGTMPRIFELYRVGGEWYFHRLLG